MAKLECVKPRIYSETINLLTSSTEITMKLVFSFCFVVGLIDFQFRSHTKMLLDNHTFFNPLLYHNCLNVKDVKEKECSIFRN